MGKKYSEELTKLLNKNVLTDDLISILYINNNRLNTNTERVEIDLVNLKMKYIDNNQRIEVFEISKINRLHFKSLIKKYNLPAWADLPMGDLLALDAPTRTITLYYDNSKIGGSHLDSYTINLYSRIPKDGMIYLEELIKYMISLKKDKNRIK